MRTVEVLFGVSPSTNTSTANRSSFKAAISSAPAIGISGLTAMPVVENQAGDNQQSSSRLCGRSLGTAAFELHHTSSRPAGAKHGEGNLTGLRVSISHTSPLEELVRGLSSLSSETSEPIEIQDVVNHSHLAIIHGELMEKTGNSVRLSEDSVGTETEATSALAIRGSHSTDSQDSLQLRFKPLFEKQVGGLPVVKEEKHTKTETKRLSLHSHGSRLTHRLALAFSASSPTLSSRNQKNITVTPKEGTPTVCTSDVSEGWLRWPNGTTRSRKTRRNRYDIRASMTVYRLRDLRQARCLRWLNETQHLSIRMLRIQDKNNPSTDNSNLTALSFVIPMFNYDLTVRAGMTSGRMEIDLLLMIEAERRKCIATGVVWNHRQIDRLSWLILEVQSLVSVQCPSDHFLC